VQSSGSIHHFVPDLIFPKSDFVTNDCEPFHPCEFMLDPDPDFVDALIEALLQLCEFSIPGFLIGQYHIGMALFHPGKAQAGQQVQRREIPAWSQRVLS
jgi:hypothetical protein